MNDPKRALGTTLAVCTVVVGIGAAVAYDVAVSRAPVQAAAPRSVPGHIDAESSAQDVLRFAETSQTRWSALRASGAEEDSGAVRPFSVALESAGRSRLEQGGVVRVRSAGASLRLDTRGRTALVAPAPDPETVAESELEGRMAVHRANDPTLARAGERLVDTPVNDLLSPARLVRTELGLAAVSVRNAGIATVAGRRAVLLEARFPAELAKEDHWELAVDAETGILLRFTIEPLPGSERYSARLDSLEIDPVVDAAAFECAVPAGYTEVTR